MAFQSRESNGRLGTAMKQAETACLLASQSTFGPIYAAQALYVRGGVTIRHARLTLAMLVILILSSCVSPLPQAELDAYRAAFVAARSANDSFLDQYVTAERSLKGSNLDRMTFAADDAAYYTTIGRPPLTKQIDRAFRAIASYNELLTTLAEGRSWDAIRPQIERTANAFSVAASMFGPEGAAAGGGIQLGGKLFAEIGGLISAVSDRKQAQELVINHSDKVLAVLDKLIEYSPNLYFEMTQQPIGDLAAAAGDAEKVKAIEGRIKTTRVLVANWVVMLQDTRGALEDLKAAAISGSLSPPDIAELAFWSEELSQHALAVKVAAVALAGAF